MLLAATSFLLSPPSQFEPRNKAEAEAEEEEEELGNPLNLKSSNQSGIRFGDRMQRSPLIIVRSKDAAESFLN